MITKTVRGEVLLAKSLLDIFIPKTVPSTNWKHWKATLDLKTCEECSSHHGQIYAVREIPSPAPPLHPYCRCVIEPMRAAEAGGCSREGENGADWWLWNGKGLPNYYIFIGDLKKLGWKKGDSPVKYAPGKMVDGGVYHNRNGHLPSAPGRIWREADLNYYRGKRNRHRVVYSNDGLIFVTYDHYETFIEVIGG